MKKKISFTLLGLSILSLIGTIVSAVIYFLNSSKVNSIEFIEVASKSIKEAKEMLDFTEAMGWVTIILIILTVVLIGGTVVMFILSGKKNKIGGETTNESN